jgi:hypothetical protein
LEERNPEFKEAYNFQQSIFCVEQWLDGLTDATAQEFKKWILSKINSSPRICAEALESIALAPPEGPKIWLKRLTRETKNWLKTQKFLCRQSTMTIHDSQYT